MVTHAAWQVQEWLLQASRVPSCGMIPVIAEDIMSRKALQHLVMVYLGIDMFDVLS